MHHPNYLFLLLPLFSVTLAQAQANGGDIEPTPAPEQAGSPAEPTPTLPGDDIAAPENGAIVPTASGQIGINPVDLPPASHAPIGTHTQYLTEEDGSTKWIGDDEWFSGSVTIGADQPDATAHVVPKGFHLETGDDGSIVITLSQWVHDEIEALAEGLPTCSAKRRRDDVLACTGRRTYEYAERILRNRRLTEQVEALSSELAETVGGEGYAAQLGEAGETLTFGGTETVEGVLQSLGTIPALAEISPQAVGVFGSIVLSVVSFNGLMEPEDEVKSMAWKFGVAKPEAIPVPEPEDDDDEEKCAKEDGDDAPAPCGSKHCVGKEEDEDPKCTVGKYKNCPCVWDGEAISQPYFSEWETVEKFLNSVGTEPWVDCDPQRDATELPESLFRGGVYDKFCEAVDKDQEQGEIWVVDQEGYKIPPKGKRDGSSPAWVPRGLSRRAPPVDLSCYKGYIIELKWEPAKDKGACSKSCKDAMLSVSNSQCGHAGAHQNTMAANIKYDVVCGEYSITIQEPENPQSCNTDRPPPPPKPTQHCFERNEFGDHEPVSEDRMKKNAKWFCDTAPHLITTTDAQSEIAMRPVFDGVDDTFFAAIDLEECGDIDEVDFREIRTCEDRMFDNWKDCNNGGTGGWIQDGCIKYLFWPYKLRPQNWGKEKDSNPEPGPLLGED